jgi:hypothetical protein
MIIDEGLLNSVKSGPRRAGRGNLIRHLQGIKLYRSQAIAAKCYDCNGMGESDECDMESCPIHPFSPYKISATKATFKGAGEVK